MFGITDGAQDVRSLIFEHLSLLGSAVKSIFLCGFLQSRCLRMIMSTTLIPYFLLVYPVFLVLAHSSNRDYSSLFEVHCFAFKHFSFVKNNRLIQQ